MSFEHHKKPLLTRKQFIRRQVRYAGFALIILLFSVGFGTAGYNLFGGLPWIDAFLNACMILTGMGPVDHLETIGGKLFAAFYALFSGRSFHVRRCALSAPVSSSFT